MSARNVMTIAIVAMSLAALALAACAPTVRAPETSIVTRNVKIPIAVTCAADPGPDPGYVDTPAALRNVADIYERVQLLLAGRAQRQARELELKAANRGCRPSG